MRVGLVIILMTLSTHTLSAQRGSANSLEKYFLFDEPPLFGFLTTYFPSFFIQNGIELKNFVRSDEFRQIRQQYDDAKAVDAIYVQAMQLTQNNTAIALLIATLATFDHRLVGIKVPIFNLFFPLTNESKEEFFKRVNNLPTRIYNDSPANASGDRDKLQHFFGSAFLAYLFESREVSERFGLFVEHGEDAFIIDGVLDSRDKRANRHGQQFGLALLENKHRLPSEFLKFHIVKTPSPDLCQLMNISCSGTW